MINEYRRRLIEAYQNHPYSSRVEYIESTGTQWIDTDYVLTGEFRIESSIQLTELQDFQTLYGFMPSPSNVTPRMGIHNYPRPSFMFGINNTITFGNSDTSLHNFIHNYSNGVESVYIDGNLGGSRNLTTTELTNNILTLGLFARKQNPIVNYSKMRLYSFKIYDGSILVRNFIPVRISSVGYLFDIVGKKLYANSGTGNFILGNDI